jgi:hypothetical protein
MGVYIIDAHLTGVHLMGLYMFPNPKRVWGTSKSLILQTAVNLLGSGLQNMGFYAGCGVVPIVRRNRRIRR